MGARSRQGCLPCRRRKKKCDETQPICTACQRNCLGCDWPAHEGAILLGQTTEWSSPSLFICRPNSFGPHTTRLIYHYVNDTTNKIVCLQDNDNPFLHTIFPTAVGDDLLMHAILALSGAHLMQRLPLASREIQRSTWSTWFNYVRALKALRVGLFTVRGSDLAILQSNLKAETLTPKHGKVGILSGCAQDLFGLMPRVSVLLKTITEAGGRPDSQGRQLIQDYRDCRSPIADWEPVCTELGASETREKKARHTFDDLKLLLSYLPPSAPYATTVTWPLFILGMVARQEEEVEMIRMYFHSLISAFGIGPMGTILAYLERVWKNDNHLDGLHGLVSNQNNVTLIC
ncbi:unnamed protein product [Penicillium salamii]|uniref:Zn(2)-C6 fungal-type domain-containing protein n=1 Tax=Penicillium salamii TaxID=1612424 RepID=A0A9W4K0P9_9EURO|nr:unnamed protein product [Penicillium salamii]CAG8045712.1 unnamed protein product [Penicillium salamii]CAG8107487.1 unnamed protein product [Penicillium salamii]CAG8184299.1 unnamed protein product [Penicillium salamii]CAG8204398.1 unnamed protein product [Penicillium salamii]